MLLERQALSVIPAAPGTPFVGDAMLSRFGEFLMKKGYITSGQLDAALGRQRELAGTGVRETLGQVLLEMRVMTREQLELASVEQVQELQSALRAANARLEQRVADRTRELEQAYRKLTELDRLKGNFISNVSHELRTPLTKIKGFNALLAAGDPGPAHGRAAAGRGGDGPRGERVGAPRGRPHPVRHRRQGRDGAAAVGRARGRCARSRRGLACGIAPRRRACR